ncbi:unnamed protein product [Phytomonas sp. EM1]|nr:unnamed protein product [Phytomonas sp. EM1]|eukprot:CCW65892.1 unnamed protein product [Phytomonas sp. isolate EM1]
MRVEEWCLHALLARAPGKGGRERTKGHRPREGKKEEKEEKEEEEAPHGGEDFAPSARIAVVWRCMTATAATPSPGRFSVSSTPSVGLGGIGGDRSALRVPYGLGKAYTQRLIRDLVNDDDATTGAGGVRHAPLKTRRLLASPLQARHLATLCAAILFFEVYTHEALRLLVEAAPRCVEAVEWLSGREISCLLLAYARLRYDGDLDGPSKHDANSTNEETKDPADGGRNFYLVLGTRAGQIADCLSEADAARVLRAFELIGLPHEDLRATLESSLRMRSLDRKIRYNTE